MILNLLAKFDKNLTDVEGSLALIISEYFLNWFSGVWRVEALGRHNKLRIGLFLHGPFNERCRSLKVGHLIGARACQLDQGDLDFLQKGS